MVMRIIYVRDSSIHFTCVSYNPHTKNPTYKIGTVIVLHCTEKESEAQEN